MWTRNEKIGLASLVLAIFSCLLASLTVREIRLMLGLPLDPTQGEAHSAELPRQLQPSAPIQVPSTAEVPAFSPPPVREHTTRILPVRTATSSSVLPPSRVARYTAEMVLDGTGNTSWVENAAGYGIGEWIELQLGASRQITHLKIRNGYDKDSRYRENGRVRSFTLTFSSGETRTFSLADHPALQTFAVGPIPTSFVRLTINSVYEGSRWEDTALGDVVVIGY